MKTKICSSCKKELPATTEYFYAEKRRKCGLRSKCKDCYVKQTEKWQEDNKQHDKERQKQYYLQNKEIIKKYVQNYYKNNKSYYTEVNKNYYKENKEYFRNYTRQWRKNNYEKYVAIRQRRRAKQKELDATLTPTQWEQIKADFDYSCSYCGMTEEEHYKVYNTQLHQEHFKALSKDGEYTHNNILPACRGCNAKKHNTDFFVWYPKQKFYSKEREKKILKYLNYTEDGKQQLTITL